MAPLLTFGIFGRLLSGLLCRVVTLVHRLGAILHPLLTNVVLVTRTPVSLWVAQRICIFPPLLIIRNKLWLLAIILIGLLVTVVHALTMLLVLHLGTLIPGTFIVISSVLTSGTRLRRVLGILLRLVCVMWRLPQSGSRLIWKLGC